MSAFLTELDGEWHDDILFDLSQPLIYQSDILAKLTPAGGIVRQMKNGPVEIAPGGILTIVTGFVTDFASVPRVPIIYEIWGDRAHHESVPHDFLYQTHLVPKHIADLVFLEAMAVRGKPWYIREPMYWGVFFGGWRAYDSGPSRYSVFNGAHP